MGSNLNDILKIHRDNFLPVVPFDETKDKLIPLDFTESNKELTEEILSDTDLFSKYISEKLHDNNALYGIGGYAEHRTVYTRSKVFDAAGPGEEPRRLHLGTDIWGDVNTPVMAPLEGIIHSYAFNDRFGDYGTTIILTHRLDGFSFYTLYGHLSLRSIKNAKEGDRVMKGETFAEFGMQFENGHWPPHLHFQLIIDLQGRNGDYPGVCKYSEKDNWLLNCPDPDQILQMNKFIS